MAELSQVRRQELARRGKQLEIFTIVWASTEAVVALWSSSRTGSVALAGFGWDSLIEVLSAAALWWRMSHEMHHDSRHRAERISVRFAGSCLLLLGVYILLDSMRHLWLREAAAPDAAGTAIAVCAAVLMPLLSFQKRKVAVALKSAAMLTDSRQTDFCMYQALIVLLGILCFRFLHVRWADSAAALVLVPILIREGLLTFRGEHCCAHH